MTDLPPELIQAIEEKSADLKHNWMYSFMPVNNHVYLVGYCKVCDHSVSALVPVDEYTFRTTITQANIPKWGCKPVSD